MSARDPLAPYARTLVIAALRRNRAHRIACSLACGTFDDADSITAANNLIRDDSAYELAKRLYILATEKATVGARTSTPVE